MRWFMTQALVLALSIALATPSAVAEPRSSGQRGGDLLSSLWNLLLPKWSLGRVHKEGARVDPLGTTQDSAPTTEEGPVGSCKEASTEAGCFIDPLG